MAPLDQHVGGRDHAPVRRVDHRRVVPDADRPGVPGGQQSLDRGDQTELAEVTDGDGSLPSHPACRPADKRRRPGIFLRPTAGYLR
jgi:hypothetical protein